MVSAHNVSGGRCREHGKHTTDRVAAGAGAVRCHTETDRQLAVAATQHRNDQLDNCDRSVANMSNVVTSHVSHPMSHVPKKNIFSLEDDSFSGNINSLQVGQILQNL